MRACIHRGSHQIGGSCVELEEAGQRLVIDLGLPLDAQENSSAYLPNVPGLDGSDPGLLGVLISHPHLDHFGLLGHISPTISIGMGPAARRILASAAPFLPGSWPVPGVGWNYQSGVTFDIGPFRVTPFLVDHSAYDSYSLLIEAGGTRLFYSGDFRAHGRKAALFDHFVANPPAGIDVLLVEGSSLQRLGLGERFPSEREIEEHFAAAFDSAAGLAMVHTSAQNIDRIVSVLRACRKTGRRLIIDLYAAAVLEATGNANIPQSWWHDVCLFVPQRQRQQIKANGCFSLLQRHSRNRIFADDIGICPERFAILFRPPHLSDLDEPRLLGKAAYIYSQWEGYWEQGIYASTQRWLERHDIERQSIHTSGHASPADLQTFVAALAPGKVVPIHSFVPERYSEIFPGVEIHNDGEWWAV